MDSRIWPTRSVLLSGQHQTMTWPTGVGWKMIWANTFWEFNNQHEPTLRLNGQECESNLQKMEFRPHNFSWLLLIKDGFQQGIIETAARVWIKPTLWWLLALDAHPIWFFGLAEVSVMPVLQPWENFYWPRASWMQNIPNSYVVFLDDQDPGLFKYSTGLKT